MKELSHYDLAMAKFRNAIQLPIFPLHSMGFFLEHYHSILKTQDDVSMLKNMAKKHHWVLEPNYFRVFEQDKVVLVTDAKLNIVFASSNMIKMNGYLPTEVIGNTPKMFQGKKTNPKTSAIIREAILNKVPFEETIVNYCKDGSDYACHIKAFPIYDVKGNCSHFLAIEHAA